MVIEPIAIDCGGCMSWSGEGKKRSRSAMPWSSWQAVATRTSWWWAVGDGRHQPANDDAVSFTCEGIGIGSFGTAAVCPRTKDTPLSTHILPRVSSNAFNMAGNSRPSVLVYG